MATLLRRETDMLVEHDPDRLRLLPYLAETLWELGDLDGAERVVDEAIRIAEEIWDDALAADARIERASPAAPFQL